MKQMNGIESMFKLLRYLKSLEKYLINPWCAAYCVTITEKLQFTI